MWYKFVSETEWHLFFWFGRYGLLGASGCGKTTLLSCIVGRRSFDSGEVLVFGGEPGSVESGIPGPRVGYMPQELALYGEFTIKETLEYFGRIYKLPKAFVKSQMDFLFNLLDLPPAHRYVKTLSGGQQRRVSFAVALFHEPELLILDEPTVGVDPLLRQRLVTTTTNTWLTCKSGQLTHSRAWRPLFVSSFCPLPALIAITTNPISCRKCPTASSFYGPRFIWRMLSCCLADRAARFTRWFDFSICFFFVLFLCSIWNHLVRLSTDHGRTVIITTHYIEEARQASTVSQLLVFLPKLRETSRKSTIVDPPSNRHGGLYHRGLKSAPRGGGVYSVPYLTLLPAARLGKGRQSVWDWSGSEKSGKKVRRRKHNISFFIVWLRGPCSREVEVEERERSRRDSLDGLWSRACLC